MGVLSVTPGIAIPPSSRAQYAGVSYYVRGTLDTKADEVMDRARRAFLGSHRGDFIGRVDCQILGPSGFLFWKRSNWIVLISYARHLFFVDH